MDEFEQFCANSSPFQRTTSNESARVVSLALAIYPPFVATPGAPLSPFLVRPLLPLLARPFPTSLADQDAVVVTRRLCAGLDVLALVRV